jgi:hypothetical protein
MTTAARENVYDDSHTVGTQTQLASVDTSFG